MEEQNLLGDIEHHIHEQQAKKYQKKIKRGRAMILIIALLNIITLSRGLEIYERGSYKLTMAGSVAVAYFIFFLISIQKTYLSLLLATISYSLITIYTIANKILLLSPVLFNGTVSQYHFMLLSDVVMGSVILYFLIGGANAAKKYDELQ